ncbi:dTDP-glucose 4,6-dehydratase, partial [hydrothermal vent metagenome]
MRNRTILVTGGAGFIGSNFIPYYLKQNPDKHVINLDLLTYAGNLANLADLENNPNYTFVKGDIRDYNLIKTLFDQYDFEGIFHFAAESHVD